MFDQAAPLEIYRAISPAAGGECVPISLCAVNAVDSPEVCRDLVGWDADRAAATTVPLAPE